MSWIMRYWHVFSNGLTPQIHKKFNRRASSKSILPTRHVCHFVKHTSLPLHDHIFIFISSSHSSDSTRQIWSYIFSRREWVSLDIDDLWGGGCPPCDILTLLIQICHVSASLCDRVHSDGLTSLFQNVPSLLFVQLIRLGYYKHLYPSQLSITAS